MMDLPFRLIPRAPAGRTDKTLMRPTTRLLLGHIRPATPTNRPGPSRQITFKTSRQSEAESDPNRSHPQYHQPEAQPVLTSEVGSRAVTTQPRYTGCGYLDLLIAHLSGRTILGPFTAANVLLPTS